MPVTLRGPWGICGWTRLANGSQGQMKMIPRSRGWASWWPLRGWQGVNGWVHFLINSNMFNIPCSNTVYMAHKAHYIPYAGFIQLVQKEAHFFLILTFYGNFKVHLTKRFSLYALKEMWNGLFGSFKPLKVWVYVIAFYAFIPLSWDRNAVHDCIQQFT